MITVFKMSVSTFDFKPPYWEGLHRKASPPHSVGLQQAWQVADELQEQRCYGLKDCGTCKKTKTQIPAMRHLLETYFQVSRECHWLFHYYKCAQEIWCVMSPVCLSWAGLGGGTCWGRAALSGSAVHSCGSRNTFFLHSVTLSWWPYNEALKGHLEG